MVWPNTEALFFDSLFASVLWRKNVVDSDYFFKKFENSPLSGPKLQIARKYDFLNSAKTKGEYLSLLFNYLRPICERFIEELAIEIMALNPKILGSTSTTEQTMASLALFSRIKREFPEIITVMGGFNCEGYAGKVLVKNFNVLDIVFSGEAENEFPIFCQKVIDSGLDAYLLETPHNCWNKFNANADKKDVPCIRLSIDSMENSPTPDFSDFVDQVFNKNALLLPHIFFPFTSSRGCWWGEKNQCSFCGLNTETLKFKSKSSEKVLAEILEFYNTYGVTKFVASDLILPSNYHNTLIEKLATAYPFKFSIFYNVKSNMNFDEVSALKKAGVDNVQPGIENFDDEELKIINKGVTGIQNIAFLKYCTINRMTVYWNILFDKHTTSKEKILELESFLPSLFHLYPPYTIRGMNYPRDSKIYNNRVKNNLKLVPHALYREIYRLNEVDIDDFAYLFVDITEGPNLFKVHNFSLLSEIYNKWKRKFTNDSFLLTYFYEDKAKILVNDQRFETARTYEYSIEYLDLFELTFGPVDQKQLLKILNDKGSNIANVIQVIERLIQDQLFYRSGNKILNLMIKI